MNVEEVSNPGYEEPRKQGRSWFACFGIGCVVLLVLCGVGALITFFTAGPQLRNIWEMMQIQQQNVTLAMESELVQEKLGSSIQPVIEINAPEETMDGDAKLLTTRQKFKGSDGEGVLVSQLRMEPGKPVEQVRLYFEFEGEEFDLSGMEDELDLDINDGDEEEPADEVEEEPVGSES